MLVLLLPRLSCYRIHPRVHTAPEVGSKPPLGLGIDGPPKNLVCPVPGSGSPLLMVLAEIRRPAGNPGLSNHSSAPGALGALLSPRDEEVRREFLDTPLNGGLQHEPQVSVELVRLFIFDPPRPLLGMKACAKENLVRIHVSQTGHELLVHESSLQGATPIL
jgi:hypothetical protein